MLENKKNINCSCLNFTFFLAMVFLILGCSNEKELEILPPPDKLFSKMPDSYTGIDFINQLDYTEEFNVYTYRNFYNGAGVGIGDINNDGLVDIYFCGNLQSNKLYLNKGNFQFEDITEKAGVACADVWSSGVSLADVNGDGLIDIYVCKSGNPEGENRYNELFINNGDLTFTEKAHEFGIADKGLSTHAAFFDFDKDGDLDCYLLNNSFRSVGGYDLRPGQREMRDPEGGNKLYRNDDNKFTDVSEIAGIYGSAIGFGLGVTIGDVNNDNWPDIFVSNDFFERDYLYINNQNGTFSETLTDQIGEASLGSMGADMADINHDGFPEIFVTDMLPEDDARMKTTTTFENWDKYQLNVKNGYHHQFTRNVLQLNNGNGTFSEIGRLAGVHATDWSWGALFSDFDNSGSMDIFVANGIYKDLTDQDYINFMADPETVREILKKEKEVIKKLVDAIPSNPIPNYAFSGNENLTFTNKAQAWGLDEPSHSNGAAYGDLDNDGDLDLVVSNVNARPFIYRNESDTLLENNHSLSINLVGDNKNSFGLGAKVRLKHKGKIYYREQNPIRGFQSSVDHKLHFGLGEVNQVDTVEVLWPNDKISVITRVPANQELTIYQNEAKSPDSKTPFEKPLTPTFKTVNLNEEIAHKENAFIDFDRDRLIYHMLSSEGPKVCKGDVNKDGLEDFYLGGAKNSPGQLFIQEKSGKFKITNQSIFEQDKISEDIDCLFFDVDNDGDQDLYVASGGNEFSNTSSALADRIYLNNGKGEFEKSPQILPSYTFVSSSCVQASDFDNDGDQDLFVGARLAPFLYGIPVSGYLLENDGKGNFKDITKEIAPELNKLGMITDGIWTDIDNDNDEDLVVVGEWMSVKVFTNEGGIFTDISTKVGFENSDGLWNCLKPGDFDKDGDIDFVLGNHGENTRLKASAEKPMSMFINDFDKNGTAEQIITVFNGSSAYPLVLRHDLVKQIPSLKKKYLKYNNYKEQTIEDVFTVEQLEKAVKLKVFTTSTSLAINNGDGTFSLKPLPVQAQLSPTYGLLINDFNHDGNQDILMGGNFSRSKPEIGIYNASYGLLLLGDGKNNFSPKSANESGFFIKGEVRDLMSIKIGQENCVMAAKNNEAVQVFSYKLRNEL